MSIRRGDLVLTDDGHYALVLSEEEVFLGNGLRQALDPGSREKLIPVPLNVYQEGGAVANFLELLREGSP